MQLLTSEAQDPINLILFRIGRSRNLDLGTEVLVSLQLNAAVFHIADLKAMSGIKRVFVRHAVAVSYRMFFLLLHRLIAPFGVEGRNQHGVFVIKSRNAIGHCIGVERRGSVR